MGMRGGQFKAAIFELEERETLALPSRSPVRRADELEQELEDGRDIGAATGNVMVREHAACDRAWDTLLTVSQHQHPALCVVTAEAVEIREPSVARAWPSETVASAGLPL